MYEIIYLLKGIVIGFSAAAPIGPVNLICIKRTLTQNKTAGMVSGFGSAFADTLFGFIAAFGLTFISNFLLSNQNIMKFLGGILLCFLGIKSIVVKPEEKKISASAKMMFEKMYGYIGDFFTTLFLTITNPVTIIFFATVFTALGLADIVDTYVPAVLIVIGIFLGSMIWWTFLVLSLSLLKKKFSYSWLLWINRVSGVIVLILGAVIFISLFVKH